MGKLQKKDEKNKLSIFLILAFLSVVVATWKLGLGLSFWIVLLLWCVIYLLFFVRPILKIAFSFWIVLMIAFILTISISFNLISISNSGGNSRSVEKSADGIALVDCTSTASDTPMMLSGWKSTIYSAKLDKNSPEVSAANNVRTFSYKGINAKTETNSMYSRIEKTDSSYISGYGTTMEVCDADNKTSKSYSTLDTDYVASDNVVASVHYFHGGKYIHGVGNYRVDVYIKDLNGKWNLVDRMNGITITE